MSIDPQKFYKSYKDSLATMSFSATIVYTREVAC